MDNLNKDDVEDDIMNKLNYNFNYNNATPQNSSYKDDSKVNSSNNAVKKQENNIPSISKIYDKYSIEKFDPENDLLDGLNKSRSYQGMKLLISLTSSKKENKEIRIPDDFSQFMDCNSNKSNPDLPLVKNVSSLFQMILKNINKNDQSNSIYIGDKYTLKKPDISNQYLHGLINDVEFKEDSLKIFNDNMNFIINETHKIFKEVDQVIKFKVDKSRFYELIFDPITEELTLVIISGNQSKNTISFIYKFIDDEFKLNDYVDGGNNKLDKKQVVYFDTNYESSDHIDTDTLDFITDIIESETFIEEECCDNEELNESLYQLALTKKPTQKLYCTYAFFMLKRYKYLEAELYFKKAVHQNSNYKAGIEGIKKLKEIYVKRGQDLSIE